MSEETTHNEPGECPMDSELISDIKQEAANLDRNNVRGQHSNRRVLVLCEEIQRQRAVIERLAAMKESHGKMLAALEMVRDVRGRLRDIKVGLDATGCTEVIDAAIAGGRGVK